MNILRTPTQACQDRKSTRLNSSHTEISTLSLHGALPIYIADQRGEHQDLQSQPYAGRFDIVHEYIAHADPGVPRSEEHTSELQSHRDLHSFPTRRSSDLYSRPARRSPGPAESTVRRPV